MRGALKPSLFNGSICPRLANTMVTINRIDGAAFAVDSIDFESWADFPLDITVFGDRADGSTVQPVARAATTCSPFASGDDFNPVVAVRFFQGGDAQAPSVHVDNVRLSDAEAAVPEPATLALALPAFAAPERSRGGRVQRMRRKPM